MTVELSTVSTTTITELIDVTNLPVVFTHPVVGFILTDFWTMEEIRYATSLQTAIDAGNVILSRNGKVIKSLSQIYEIPSPIIEIVTASATILDATDLVLFNGGVGQTLTLPTPVTNDGKLLTMKNISANAVDITSTVGNIDGYTTISFTGGNIASFTITSDGANWRAI